MAVAFQCPCHVVTLTVPSVLEKTENMAVATGPWDGRLLLSFILWHPFNMPILVSFLVSHLVSFLAMNPFLVHFCLGCDHLNSL